MPPTATAAARRDRRDRAISRLFGFGESRADLAVVAGLSRHQIGAILKAGGATAPGDGAEPKAPRTRTLSTAGIEMVLLMPSDRRRNGRPFLARRREDPPGSLGDDGPVPAVLESEGTAG